MKKYLFIICIIFYTTSCDVLNMNPLDKISDADTWTDQNLIELYVNGTYPIIQHGLNRANYSVACDEAFSIHNNGRYYYIQDGEISSDNVATLDVRMYQWKDGYSYVKRINTFLSKIENTPVDDDFKKTSIGEMKFIRAWIYANLIWKWGGVPIITNIFELNENYDLARNSYDECVDFIISELDDAISRLPDKQPEAGKGRASADACRALKARVYLYAASVLNNPSNDKAKWQKAADTAESLLNAGYKMHDEYEEIFLKETGEIIFARYLTTSSSANFQWVAGRSGSNGSNEMCPTQNMVNAYEMKATGKLPYHEGTLNVNTESGYDDQKPYEGRDPRFYASILYDGAMFGERETQTYHGGTDSPGSSIGPWNASMTAYIQRKCVDETVPIVGTSIHQTNPWVYFRYSEILLNYAEAKFELGDEETAREYLNKIRARQSVDMPPVTDTGDALRKRIQNERRVELAFEEHRFYDVRRWKIAMETENQPIYAININKLDNGSKTYDIIKYKNRIFLKHHYLLPIPRTEVERSNKMLEQNPGY